MNEQKLRDLLWEATADCHDEEEQFWGIFYTQWTKEIARWPRGGLIFPLQARMLGEPAEVVDLDGGNSDLRRGIAALVRKGDREYSVALADLEFVDPDPASAESLEMYQYWLKLR